MLRTEAETVKSPGWGNYPPDREGDRHFSLQLMTTEGAAVDKARGKEEDGSELSF